MSSGASSILKDSASGQTFDFKGKKVTVIGGGNVAMDVARTARRQGGQVTLIALETREEMPASPWEVAEAEAEGVTDHPSLGRQADCGQGWSGQRPGTQGRGPGL